MLQPYPHLRGTSHLWTIEYGANPLVRYAVLDPIDFAARPWVSQAHWPIAPDDVVAHCRRAHAFSGAGDMDYRPERWITPERQPLALAPDVVQSKMFSFANREVFRTDLRDRIIASDKVTLYLWSNAVELETAPSGDHIREVRVACLDGNRFKVRAAVVILAMGAFDVPRLLLASRRHHPAGLGNQSDQLGRNLMDHQIVDAGTLWPAAPGLFSRMGFYDQRNEQGSRVVANLQLTGAAQAEHQLLNSFFGLTPRSRLPLSTLARRPFGRPTTLYSPAVNQLKAWRRPESPAPFTAGGVLKVLSRIDDIWRDNLHRFPGLRAEFNIDNGGWFEDPERDRRFAAFDLYQMCEQAPDPQNRITLSAERDAVGMPKAVVRFRWGEAERRSIARSQELLRDHLAQAGVGRLVLERRDGEPVLRQMTTHHPAGTTRMSDSAATGVVDANSKVFGVDNLFVASSSVFPVSGAANPTLMILAIALRVAETVKSMLATGVELL
ncbi:MAG: GMC family oxidoreductase [Burkholderiaceae bacterium]